MTPADKLAQALQQIADFRPLTFAECSDAEAIIGIAESALKDFRAAPGAEPMFWVRLCSDGTYEGPIHNNSIERVRRLSGAWTPLYAATQPAPQPEAQALSSSCGNTPYDEGPFSLAWQANLSDDDIDKICRQGAYLTYGDEKIDAFRKGFRAALNKDPS